MQTIERPMTLEEFDALPESNRPIQLIEGQLVVAPSPDVRCQIKCDWP